MLEIVFSTFPYEYIVNLLMISQKVIKNMLDDNFYNTDTKSLQEDLLLYKAACIIRNLGCFCLDEFNLKYSEDVKIKMDLFLQNTEKVYKKNI